MTRACSILLLEDEPLVLMDLEFAVIDQGCAVIATSTCGEALETIGAGAAIDVAVLDVSLGGGRTCFPVAQALSERGIPFLLHTGDLDRHDERLRQLRAQIIAKPASSEQVIAAALRLAAAPPPGRQRTAAQ